MSNEVPFAISGQSSTEEAPNFNGKLSIHNSNLAGIISVFNFPTSAFSTTEKLTIIVHYSSLDSSWHTQNVGILHIERFSHFRRKEDFKRIHLHNMKRLIDLVKISSLGQRIFRFYAFFFSAFLQFKQPSSKVTWAPHCPHALLRNNSQNIYNKLTSVWSNVW